jgi:hypothetical protein
MTVSGFARGAIASVTSVARTAKSRSALASHSSRKQCLSRSPRAMSMAPVSSTLRYRKPMPMVSARSTRRTFTPAVRASSGALMKPYSSSSASPRSRWTVGTRDHPSRVSGASPQDHRGNGKMAMRDAVTIQPQDRPACRGDTTSTRHGTSLRRFSGRLGLGRSAWKEEIAHASSSGYNQHTLNGSFTGSAFVRDVVIGMSDELTVPFALAPGLSGSVGNTFVVVVAGLAEVTA